MNDTLVFHRLAPNQVGAPAMHHRTLSPTPVAPIRRRRVTSRPSLPRRCLGVVTDPETFRSLAYLLAGLPLGTLWFTLVITGVSVGLSLLVVALAGVPLLLGLWYVVRLCANVERRAANALLGTTIPDAPMATHLRGNPWRRLRALSGEPERWREAVYLLLRFPVGVLTATAALTLLTTSVYLAWAPFEARRPAPEFGSWRWSPRIEDLAASGWSWLLVPAGAVALVVSLHLLNGLARACGRWASSSLHPEGDRPGHTSAA